MIHSLVTGKGRLEMKVIPTSSKTKEKASSTRRRRVEILVEWTPRVPRAEWPAGEPGPCCGKLGQSLFGASDTTELSEKQDFG